MEVWQVLQKIIATVGTVMSVIMGVWGGLTYLLRCGGMFKIARRRKIKGAWLVWLPMIGDFTLGAIDDHYQRQKYGHDCGRRKKLLILALLIQFWTVLLPMIIGQFVDGTFQEIFEMAKQADTGWLIVISLAAAIFGLVTATLFILQMVVQYKAYYNLFASCKPKLAVPFLILSIMTPANPFLVFACRKSDDGIPEQTEV